MKTISLSVYNRPEALKRMLESLRNNNMDGWTLIVSIDDSPHQDDPLKHDIVEFCKSVGMNFQIVQQPFKLGLTLNTFLAPSLAFAAGSDFNLYLEDDLILSPDALDLCNWYHDGDHHGVGLKLWEPTVRTPEWGITTGQGGHGNGFCCTRHQWESFWRKEWFGYGTEGPGHIWDCWTDTRLRELGLHILSPLFPRSVQQRIDGTHGKLTDENPLTSVQIYDGPPVKEFRIV